MRAAIFRNGEIVADTWPDPVPGAGQVLVKTLACGICGSDLHARKHAHRMAEITRRLNGRRVADGPVARRGDGPRVLLRGAGLRALDREALQAGTRVCSVPALLARRRTADGLGYSNDNAGGYARVRMRLTEPLLLRGAERALPPSTPRSPSRSRSASTRSPRPTCAATRRRW